MNKKVLAWTAAAIYCILIFIGSSIPGDALDTGPPGLDKILHVFEYLLLSLLLFRAWHVSMPSSDPRTIVWLTIVVSTFYGVSDEIHQLFVPFREFDLVDIVGDFLGSLLGPYWLSGRSNKETRVIFNP